jgi:hypothetical protein
VYFLENINYLLDEEDFNIEIIKKILFIIEKDDILTINNTYKSAIYNQLKENFENLERRIFFNSQIFLMYYIAMYISKNEIHYSIKSTANLYFFHDYLTRHINKEFLENILNILNIFKKIKKISGIGEDNESNIENHLNNPEKVIENISQVINGQEIIKTINNKNNTDDKDLLTFSTHANNFGEVLLSLTTILLLTSKK